MDTPFTYSQMYLLQALGVGFSLALVGFVVEAIRRNRLNERYAILWLAAGAVLLTLSIFRPLLHWVALSLGVSYPPSLLFLVCFLFLLMIVLHYSLVLSAQRDAIRRLTQALAFLERAVNEAGGSPRRD